MVFLSDIIQANIRQGLKPFLIKGKKLVMLFTCPECKKLKMVKFTQKASSRGRKHQCTCGYIRYTSAWIH